MLVNTNCCNNDVTYECTARYTSQRKQLAELEFANLGNKGRSLMVETNIPLTSRHLLFREAFKKLDSLVITTVGTNKATRDEHLYGYNPN
jgi:hypothetical protein